MIVVDSIVWIDFFNGIDSPEVTALRRSFGSSEILVGDLVIYDVLQGFRSDLGARRAERALAKFDQASMVGPQIAVNAAAHYRTLRALGVTVRKTVDVLIATFCLAHNHALLHNDRDYDHFLEQFGLRSLSVR